MVVPGHVGDLMAAGFDSDVVDLERHPNEFTRGASTIQRVFFSSGLERGNVDDSPEACMEKMVERFSITTVQYPRDNNH